MSLLAQPVIAIAVAGFAGGIKWHAGIDAKHELEAQQARESDARQQRGFNDQVAGQHTGTLEILNAQLGDARAKIARLSGRPCLSVDAVRVLNATGVVDLPAAPINAASAPQATAAGPDDRYATDNDVAGNIALCRTEYGKTSDQLHQILNIEDRRHPPGASP